MDEENLVFLVSRKQRIVISGDLNIFFLSQCEFYYFPHNWAPGTCHLRRITFHFMHSLSSSEVRVQFQETLSTVETGRFQSHQMELCVFAISLKSSSQLAILYSSVDSFSESQVWGGQGHLRTFPVSQDVICCCCFLKFDPETWAVPSLCTLGFLPCLFAQGGRGSGGKWSLEALSVSQHCIPLSEMKGAPGDESGVPLTRASHWQSAIWGCSSAGMASMVWVWMLGILQWRKGHTSPASSVTFSYVYAC